MNARHALLLIALPLALAGCGNKGPLVMPEAPVEEAPETEADTVPVEIDVPETLPDPTAADPLLDDTGSTDPATTGDDGADPDGNG